MNKKTESVGKNVEKNAATKSTVLPNLENFSSKKEWEKASWQKIVESGELLLSLATSNEQHNLVMRAAVLDGLNFGKGQRQLSRELSLSTQTINVVRKAMGENNYRSYLERSKKERKKRKYSYDLSPRMKHKGRPVRTKYGTLYIP